MNLLSKTTAMDVALAYREIETAEKLLADIVEARKRQQTPDIRDAFGRPAGGLQLGVPFGDNNGRQLFDVPWSLARPIIEAHIANHRARIVALTEKARHEIGATTAQGDQHAA